MGCSLAEGVGHNVRVEVVGRMYGVSRHLVVCQFTRVYDSPREEDGGAEIEAALRSKASAEEKERWKESARGDVFARAGRQKDGRNIREPT